METVARVLSERPGVRRVTIDRVQAAINELGYVRDTAAANLARGKTYQFVFVLPDGKGQFLASLKNAIEEAAGLAKHNRTEVRTILSSVFDQTALSETLNTLQSDEIDGLAIMANETPVVRDASSRLRERGVPVVSLISDQPNSDRDHFVGIDNVAAGRTAGMLMGRFLGARKGKIIVVITSKQARDMVERRHGFDQILAEKFPNLEALPSIEGRDDPRLTEEITRRALSKNPDAIGVYSVGASVRGVANAILERNAGNRPICIDHELTENSSTLLRQGILDAVITQNTGHVVRSALRFLRAKCDGVPVIESQESIRIEIVIKENMPSDD